MKTLKAIGYAALMFAMFDIMILFGSLAQIGMEGRTGYWAPFWRVQAEALIRLLQ